MKIFEHIFEIIRAWKFPNIPVCSMRVLMHVRGSDESDDLDGMSRGTRVLGPARRAVCRRGDDFCNPVVQVYGYRERHGLPLFIVDLLRIYKSRRAAGFRCIIDGYEELPGAQAGQQNSFDQRLQL
jgi:hypothetical protein